MDCRSRPFWAISSWTAAFFLRWNSWTAFLVEGSGYKLESSQARVFHPHFSVLEGSVNSMEQKTRVFCQIDVQEFHLWRRKGQGHLSPFVILELISRRRKGKGHFDQLLYTLWLFLGEGGGKDLQNLISDNLQHCCANVLWNIKMANVNVSTELAEGTSSIKGAQAWDSRFWYF